MSMATILIFATRHYRHHAVVFAVALPLLTVLMLFAGWRWLFWPAMAWVFVFAVHFLVVKSLTVEDDWVDERTSDIVENAYDLGHIMSIRRHCDDLSSGNRHETESAPKTDTPADNNTANR